VSYVNRYDENLVTKQRVNVPVTEVERTKDRTMKNTYKHFTAFFNDLTTVPTGDVQTQDAVLFTLTVRKTE
jgi:hypothetical protein